MKCGSCGFDTDGKRFCTNCGAPLNREAEPAERTGNERRDFREGGQRENNSEEIRNTDGYSEREAAAERRNKAETAEERWSKTEATERRNKSETAEERWGETEAAEERRNKAESAEERRSKTETTEEQRDKTNPAEEPQDGAETSEEPQQPTADNFAEELNSLLNEVRVSEGDRERPLSEETPNFALEEREAESEAMLNLKKFEEGSITHPKDKPREKRKFYCPQNPMLWAFLCLLVFGLILGGLTAFFFNVELDGAQIVFGIAFAVFTAAVLAIDFVYYLPAAWELDRLLKGKGVRLEYKLKKYETAELAQRAKKRNRGFYLAIGLFGLAFSVYYIYIIANAIVTTNLMWISLIFSICVFVIFALLFFIMPKINYDRMMVNGEKVIIGSKSVYYGGVYYHWRRIQPEATFGNLNTKRHKLDITFTQEFKNGASKRRKVEIYAPDSAIRGISELLREYETSVKRYQEKQERNSIINDLDSKDKNNKKKEKR